MEPRAQNQSDSLPEMTRSAIRRQGGEPPLVPALASALKVAGVAAVTVAMGAVPATSIPDGVLDRYDLEAGIDWHELSRRLDEVSGLAFDGQGRLWAHDDERARIYQLDPSSGEVLAHFDVGRRIAGDWEGLAWAEGSLFLVDSDGVLVRFTPGAPDERVPYRRIETGLGSRCEIEGLGFERPRRALLIGCKTSREQELNDRIVVFAFSLATTRAEEAPRVSIPTTALDAFGLSLREFRTSAVETHPRTGAILVASAQDATIVEVSSDGSTVIAGRAPGDRPLRQLEGLAVAPDGALILASEAAGRRAILAHVPLGPEGDP